MRLEFQPQSGKVKFSQIIPAIWCAMLLLCILQWVFLAAVMLCNFPGLPVDTSQCAMLLSHVLDLLSLCVERHSYHIRNYILKKDVLGRVLVLMTSSHGHLSLGEKWEGCLGEER